MLTEWQLKLLKSIDENAMQQYQHIVKDGASREAIVPLAAEYADYVADKLGIKSVQYEHDTAMVEMYELESEDWSIRLKFFATTDNKTYNKFFPGADKHPDDVFLEVKIDSELSQSTKKVFFLKADKMSPEKLVSFIKKGL